MIKLIKLLKGLFVEESSKCSDCINLCCTSNYSPCYECKNFSCYKSIHDCIINGGDGYDEDSYYNITKNI